MEPNPNQNRYPGAYRLEITAVSQIVCCLGIMLRNTQKLSVDRTKILVIKNIKIALNHIDCN